MGETENILLMFLSSINPKIEPVYLGISTNPKGEITKTTNESAVRYILYKECRGESKLGKIFIFASNAVRETLVAGSDKTHLQYFKDRIGEFVPNIDEYINDDTIYNYDEKSSGIQNMIAVAEMAERIQKYSAGKKVVLHVDLTGGMRNVNMMMLDIIRLLEYSGIEIGRLIYSYYQRETNNGFIHEIKNIYELPQLISGVEEFINFGSVAVLKKYYAICKNPISARLQNLIDAMEDFSEAIKLCHTNEFIKSIKKLHDAINDFEVAPDNVQDIFMARLIGRIREEYENLIATRGEDDLKIIRWCVDKGHLQQALTLYTERVPEYLGNKGFLHLSKANIQILDELVAKDKLKRQRWFYLLNAYDSKNHTGEGFKQYCKAVKNDAVNLIKQKKFNYDEWRGKLDKSWTPLKISCADEELLRSQLNLLAEMQKNPAPLLNLDDEKLEPIRNILTVLKKKLETLPKGFERLKEILIFVQTGMDMKDFTNYFPEVRFDAEKFEKYPYAYKIYEVLYDKTFWLSSISEEKFLDVMEKYYLLKNERNQSNHAKNYIGKFPRVFNLKKYMNAALDELETATRKV